MILEDFSAGYLMATDVQVETYPGARAIVSQDTYDELSHALWPPFIGTVGGAHFELQPETAVPDGMVAVPRDEQYRAHTDDVLLISKNNGREVFGLSSW